MMFTALGLMSGTSLDGVDVALIETDGETVASFGPTGYRAYASAERLVLRQALAASVDLTDRTARSGIIAAADAVVTQAHAEAVKNFLDQNRIRAADIAVAGFHGQTVLHRPERRLTVQIGDGRALAALIAMPVVYDFRAADVHAGGQGAPLVPVYHRALVQGLALDGPVAVVNIGGVSNITYIDGDDLIACDTGPGNALIDDFMERSLGLPFDDEGRLAAQGRVDQAFVARALEMPFFARKPPKSLDRNDFAALELAAASPADGAATLTAFTAAAIAHIMALLPRRPRRWILCGGGARNLTLLSMLNEEVAPAVVQTASTLSWSSDALEAQAFAFLAVRSQKGLALSYPGTTGVAVPMCGGVLARP